MKHFLFIFIFCMFCFSHSMQGAIKTFTVQIEENDSRFKPGEFISAKDVEKKILTDFLSEESLKKGALDAYISKVSLINYTLGLINWSTNAGVQPDDFHYSKFEQLSNFKKTQIQEGCMTKEKEQRQTFYRKYFMPCVFLTFGAGLQYLFTHYKGNLTKIFSRS